MSSFAAFRNQVLARLDEIARGRAFKRQQDDMPLLTWLTRDDDIHRATQAPYRLLEEVPELSSGDRDTGNMFIQGDNLHALKALLPYYAGKVKCIYIDPPYNTRSAFEHYDDKLGAYSVARHDVSEIGAAM